MSRATGNIDEECLHGVSSSSSELKILFNVFKGTDLNDDSEYLENFILSLKRRPCSSWIQPIVEQTTFHFLCKDVPPPSVSSLTEDDVMFVVNRLHQLFVTNGNKYDAYKRKINELEVHDENGDLVPVLDFKSFKDGKTALDAAKSLQNGACLQVGAEENKLSLEDLKTKGKKVEEIITSIKSASTSPNDDGTWNDVAGIETEDDVKTKPKPKKRFGIFGGKSKKCSKPSKRRAKNLRSKTRRRRA